jgi:hypothetical protein
MTALIAERRVHRVCEAQLVRAGPLARYEPDARPRLLPTRATACTQTYEWLKYAIVMPRGSNIASTEPLRLSTTPQVLQLLDHLASTGLHGKNRAEVAEEMLRAKLRELIREGVLKGPRTK